MSHLDIAAIRARADAATSGPWSAIEGGQVEFGDREELAAIPFGCDHEFIAAARSDVPALCDEVERLRAEIDRLRTGHVCDVCAALRDVALDDERTMWPHSPGTANGPRVAAAIVHRFAAGESLALLADDFGVNAADIVLAIRCELRALLVFGAKIRAAIDQHNAPLKIGAPRDTPPADAGFEETR